MGINGFLDVERVRFPLACIEKAYEHMRYMGTMNLEGVALFAGKQQGIIFEVLAIIIPKQKSMDFEDGLLYSVGEEELSRISAWLYENKISLFAQIHSHPTRAYHSETDDAYAIIAKMGGVSVVVPNFASGPIDPTLWAVYRLDQAGTWLKLEEQDVARLIEITY